MLKELLSPALVVCNVLFVVTLSLLTGCADSKSDYSVNSQPPPSAGVPSGIQISASDFAARYHEDETAADEMFKDKAVNVTGVVVGVREDMMGFKYIELHGDNDHQFVNATLNNKELPKLEFLKKGQTITVHCMGDGQRVGSPILEDCTIL